MKDARTQPTPCPFCGYAIDAHAAVGHEQHMPEPGNISVCFRCAGVSKYTEQLSLDPMTEEELTLIKVEDPETYYYVQRIRDGIRKFFADEIIKKL